MFHSNRWIALSAAVLLGAGVASRGADVFKANNTDNLNLGSSWVGGTPPGAADVAVWDSTVTGDNATALGADTTWNGIRIANPGGAVTINAGNILTNGSAGIDMSAATTNLTLNNAIVLSDTQTWNVASGLSLTVGGTVAGATNVPLTKTGGGVLVLSSANIANLSNLVISGGSVSIIGATTYTLSRVGFSNNATFNNGMGNNNVWQFSNVTVAADSVVNLNYGARGSFGRSGAVLAFGSNVTINARVDTTIDRNFFAGDWSSFQGTINIIGNSPSAILNLSPNSASVSFNNSANALTNALINLSSSIPGTNFITLAGTLNSGGNTIAIGGLMGTADAFISPKQNGTATWSIGALNSNTTFAGVINNGTSPGGSHVVKVGTATLILSGNNAYNRTVISGGTLQFGAGGTTGRPGTGDITNNANLAFNRSDTLLLTNNIAGTGTVVQAGSGTLVLLGTNTYAGPTVINAGTLSVDSDARLGTPPGSPTPGSLVINDGVFRASAGFTLDANRGIALGPTSGSGSGTISVAAGQTLVYNGVVADNGGTGSLIKSGSGALELGGSSTHSGGTTVGAGDLRVTGTVSGNATVASGGILSGNGTITGTVTVQSGGTVSPGVSVGTLNVGSLTMNAGSVYNFEFNSTPANDTIVVANSGGLTINGGVFNLYQENTILGWTTLGTYNLIQFTGTPPTLDSSWTTPSPGNPHVGNPQAGFSYSFAISGGWLQVTIAGGANIGTWGVDSDGNWSVAGNWTATTGTMPPRNPGDVATLGVGSALRTVTLDANETIGGLSFTNPNSFVIANAGNTLTLDNSGGGVQVNVTDGTANDIRAPVSLNDKATVSVTSGKSLKVSGTISGTSTGNTLTAISAGTVILTGTNTYGPAAGFVGTTFSGGGTLQLGNNRAIGAGDLSVNSNATIKPLASFTISNNIVLGTSTTPLTMDVGANNVTMQGVISGSGGWLTKIGSGTLTLNAANTYFNNTTISEGTLKLGVTGAIPSGGSTTGWLVLDGGDTVAGTLDLNGRDQTVNALSGTNNSVLGQIVNNSGSGTTMLTVNNGPGIDTLFAGVIQDNNNATSGKVALTLAGPGTLTLSGANSYSGGTTVSNGTLRIGNGTALGSGTLTMSGGNLDSTVGNLFNNIPQVWNSNFTFLGTSSLDIGNGAVSLGATVQVTVSANVLTVRGPISGPFGLTKAGAGTLTLTGINSYSGDTTAAGGNLLIDSGGVITGGAANVSAVVGATLEVRNGSLFASGGNIGTPSAGLVVNGGTATFSGALTMTPGNNNNSLIQVVGGTLTAGSLSLGRTATFTTTQPTEGFTTVGLYLANGTVNIVSNFSMGDNAAANSTVNARMDGGTLTVGGALIVGLNNTGRWSIMDVHGGTLTVNDTTMGISLGSSQSGNAILLVQNGGMATTPKISLGQAVGGTNHTFGTSVISLSSAGTLYVGSGGIVQVSTNLATAIWLSDGTLGAAADWSSSLAMTVSNTTIQAADSTGNAHNITLSGAISGSSFTKTGGGVLTLSSLANSYTDGATVNAGTLLINGSVASGVNVNSGGRLGGSGTINGAVSIADGATLSPGASVGILTINGNLTLNNTSTLAYELGVSSDRTVVNGDLTLDGVVNVSNAGGLANGNYTLITYTGALTDNILNVGTLPSPFTGSVSNDLVNKRVVLVVSGGAPPDPFATWQNQYFGCTNCPQALPGADPDGDGMSNTNEFLAGFNPTNSTAYLHIINVARSGNDINVTYLGANGDINGSPGPKTNVLEFTTGAAGGVYSNNFTSAGVTNILTGGTGLGVVTNMVDVGGATNTPARYYRVRVLAP